MIPCGSAPQTRGQLSEWMWCGFFFDGANPENDQKSREAPWDPNTQGRWPPNLIYAPKVSRKERELGCDSLPSIEGWRMTNRKEGTAGLNSPRAGAGRTQSGLKKPSPHIKTDRPDEVALSPCNAPRWNHVGHIHGIRIGYDGGDIGRV